MTIHSFLDSPIEMLETNRYDNFIEDYLKYTDHTECPVFFHRWTAISCLAAYLGRSIHFQHGHFTIYPNLYVMLVGVPGTKKSSSIKIGAKLLRKAGYTTFGAKKTRQEKFLMDLASQADRHISSIDDAQDLLEANLFQDDEDDLNMERFANCPPCEVFVAADEFNNFIGPGNLDFMTLLGELWDFDEGVFDHRLKNSKSVYIPDPVVNILGGNTATGIADAFPVSSIGHGFFSRMLFVYCTPTDIKWTFPPEPDLEIQQHLIHYLARIKEGVKGRTTITPEARDLMDTIYKTWPGIDDLRFEHYANRRLTQLIKITLIVAASRISTNIDVEDIIYANTILTFTEHLMPKALGEFGRARHSDVTHRVMTALDQTRQPMSLQQLWQLVHQDLDNRQQLMEILNNLIVASKIQGVTGGFLPIKKVFNESMNETVDWSILTPQEKDLR